MPWFNVDDNFAFHPKAIQAGNAALGLWVRSGAWCRQTLSDGFVPRSIARQLGTKSNADRLVNVGLWIEQTDGYLFHEWSQRQRSKTEVESDREANRRRQDAYRERQKIKREYESNGVTQDARNGVTQDARNGVSNGAQAKPSQAKRTTYVESAADGNVPSARSGGADTFSDDTPMPEEPPRADWDTDGSSALAPVHQLRPKPPAHVETASAPARIHAGSAAASTVALHVPKSLGISSATRRDLAEQAQKLMNDPNVHGPDIETALQAWAKRSDAGPGLLRYLVDDAARSRAGGQTRTTATRPEHKTRTYANLINELEHETVNTRTELE